MLEDRERMMSYRTAIMTNKAHFEGKTVMDVGAGSGILSVFCALAGAKKVYAVEASDAVNVAREIVKENNFESVIEIIHSKVEDVELPDNEKVDVIVSEWMGFYLLHEGMLDSVIHARDLFLKPGGRLYPETATVYMAPCRVPSLYDFWNDVHGVKMNSFASLLRSDKSKKPEVMKVEPEDLLAEPTALCWIDLNDAAVDDIGSFEMKHVAASKAGAYQGVCIWFDCQFPVINDSDSNVILSTSPSNPVTHWKQTVIVLPEEQILEENQPVAWNLSMKRSEENSRRYDLQLSLLDPEVETHPMPCNCHMTKCIVLRTYLEQHPDGKESLDEMQNDDAMGEIL